MHRIEREVYMQDSSPAHAAAAGGTGLENGLYKFSVTVPETPPETVRLGVGDMSVAVTNAGEYVFLLGKGFEYALDASSPCATNFTYFATDDLGGPGNALRSASRSASSNYDSGEDVWTSDPGALSIVFPFGAIKWNPKIEMIPARWHPSRANSSHMFRPAVSDVPGFAGMSYRWSSSDESVCSVSGASERTATFSCHFPEADDVDFVLSLEMSFHSAFLSGAPVHATFTHRHQRLDLEADYEEEVYLEDIPPDSRGMMLFSAAPSVKFFERGRAEEMQHSTLGCWYVAEEYGTMELSMSGDEVEVTDGEWRPVSDGYRWNVRKGTTCARHFHVESMVPSSSPSGTVFTVTFTPVPSEGTNEISRTASVAFVEWETETVADWPADRSRKTIGVCEDVFLRFEPEMPNLVLSKSCPESKLAKKGDGSWLYRAPLDPVVDSIRESLCGGEIAAFEVVAPTGYDARRVEINRNQGVFGVAGSFQIKFYLTLLPTNVSFRALDIKEVGKYASPATGYFAEPRNKGFLFHSTADVWSEVLPKNRGTDYAQMAELDPPWNGGGTLRWPIPNVYRRRKTEEENQDGNEERFFCDTDQYFSVGSNGTSSISKFDWIVTCTTNRIFSVWRIDRQ